MTTSEKITTFFSFAHMHIILIICGILIISTIIILIFLEKERAKATNAKHQLKRLKNSEEMELSETYDITSSKHLMHDEYETYHRSAKKLRYLVPLCVLTVFIMFMATLTALSVYNTYTTAQKHGYYKGLDADAVSIWKHIHNSPEEDTLPTDIHGKIIIYFRFGCPDCSAVYPELSNRLSELTDVYWISSRSPQGKELLKTYPVEEVPSILYVKYDNTYSTAILYKKNADNVSYLDKKTLEDFLTMVAYDRGSYTEIK